jgi:uncharacterized protein YbjT (DUF2867 family)
MILITGASGNVGKEVLAQIAGTGYRVRAAFQSLSKASVPKGVEAVRVDYNEPESLRSALRGVEGVFLVGPPTSQLISLERKATDVLGESNVKRVVKLSAMGGRDATFPRQHAESEDYIRSKKLPYTFLRPNGFMQNLVNYSSATIQSMGKFFGSEGEGKVSYIDIRDVAAVAVKTLTEDGHIGKKYTLTGPEALSNHQVARTLTEVLGREIQFVNLAPDDLEAGLLAAGVPEWNADALIDLQRLYRTGKAAAVTEDVERILGRRPGSLRQFVLDYRNAFEPAAVSAD